MSDLEELEREGGNGGAATALSRRRGICLVYWRIQRLPLEEIEKAEAFKQFYLGEKDQVFYQYVRGHFDAVIMRAYWEKRFANSFIGTRGFARNLREYLTSGAGLEGN